jgi:hypothetical protein
MDTVRHCRGQALDTIRQRIVELLGEVLMLLEAAPPIEDESDVAPSEDVRVKKSRKGIGGRPKISLPPEEQTHVHAGDQREVCIAAMTSVEGLVLPVGTRLTVLESARQNCAYACMARFPDSLSSCSKCRNDPRSPCAGTLHKARPIRATLGRTAMKGRTRLISRA